MELSIRLTSDSAEFDDVVEIIDEVCDKYIIALEHATSRHFQCYVNYIGVDDVKYSNLRYRFKVKGYKGNGQLSITKMRGDNLKIYVLKEGNYIYKGFTEEQIADLASQSYDKPKGYKELKREVSQRYVDGEINMDELLRSLIRLHTEFNVEYYDYKVIAYVRMLEFKRFPENIEDEVFNLKIKMLGKDINK